MGRCLISNLYYAKLVIAIRKFDIQTSVLFCLGFYPVEDAQASETKIWVAVR